MPPEPRGYLTYLVSCTPGLHFFMPDNLRERLVFGRVVLPDLGGNAS